jgi:octaprenyl-diphosphate synthase
LEPAAAIEQLRDTATPARTGDATARRIADVHALFGDDMARVNELLSAAVRDGLHPATESARHLLDAGGKRIRPLALLLSAACFGPIGDPARDLAVVAELIHLATLLHDDVVDDGTERRGQVASRIVWGNAVSVLAGDLLLTHALERTRRVATPGVLEELLSTLRKLVDGEVVQLRGRTTLDVRRATYFQIVENKTASLFVWAARAGAATAHAPRHCLEALGSYGAHVGLAFQLVDDALDYAADPRLTGKTLHGDLREGKITLPLILAAEQDRHLIVDIQSAREGDAEAALRIASAVQELRACDAVRQLAVQETQRALACLGALPPSTARELLASIARELVARAG